MFLVLFATYLELEAMKIKSGFKDMDKEEENEKNDGSGNIQ